MFVVPCGMLTNVETLRLAHVQCPFCSVQEEPSVSKQVASDSVQCSCQELTPCESSTYNHISLFQVEYPLQTAYKLI